jgi:signal transduction histidine kinase
MPTASESHPHPLGALPSCNATHPNAKVPAPISAKAVNSKASSMVSIVNPVAFTVSIGLPWVAISPTARCPPSASTFPITHVNAPTATPVAPIRVSQLACPIRSRRADAIGTRQAKATMAMTVSLRRATHRASDDPELVATLAQVESELRRSLEELRELARGIHPAILTDSGLGPALESLAERSSLPTRVDGSLDGRLPAAIEGTAYFVASEALANAAKHARANEVVVRVDQRDVVLRLEVRDDGRGGATATGSGLRGLADRVAAVGGRFTVNSPHLAGTTIVAELPCVS